MRQHSQRERASGWCACWVTLVLAAGCGSEEPLADSQSQGTAGVPASVPQGGSAGGSGIPCNANRDCRAAGLLCEVRRGQCVECLAALDCGDGLACLNGTCSQLVACENTRECPIPLVCEDGVCLECSADGDCAVGQTCVGGLCRVSCTSGRDCAELGLLCDAQTGTCVDCVTTADCGSGLVCTSGRCTDVLAGGAGGAATATGGAAGVAATGGDGALAGSSAGDRPGGAGTAALGGAPGGGLSNGGASAGAAGAAGAPTTALGGAGAAGADSLAGAAPGGSSALAGASSAGGAHGGGSIGGAAGAAGSPVLLVTNGYVNATSGNFGVHGAVYTFVDGAGSTISPQCSADGSLPCFGSWVGTIVCVSGTGAAVPYDDPDYYSRYWGAGWGVNLNQGYEFGSSTQAFPAADLGLAGFKFTLYNIGGSTVRFKYKILGDDQDYCITASSGENIIYFSSVRQSCWTTGGASLTSTQINSVEAIQWQVPTEYGYSTPFNFCVSQITPLAK